MVRDEAIAMARRIGDRQGLALVLSRSYWLRGPTPFRDILDMLAEGRDIAQQLGDIEIGAEAFQWRIASLIAIGDLSAARIELAALLDMAGRMRQPFALHVAEHYAAAIALCDGRLREAEAAAERSREWSRLLAGRDPSERLRHPDVRHPPRAGTARRAGAGGQGARRLGQLGGMAARARRAHGRARDDP